MSAQLGSIYLGVTEEKIRDGEKRGERREERREEREEKRKERGARQRRSV